jgi:transposase
MKREQIRLGTKEQRRAFILNQLLSRVVDVGEAAQLLGLSPRQIKRLKARYRVRGPAALVHGNQGRSPWQAVSATREARVLELAQGRYAGFNHQHLTEMLAEREGMTMHRTTVRRILLKAGLRSPRTRRSVGHRRRRERMPREGMLLQADASRHRWLGPSGPYLTLVGAIDDATGTVPGAIFREHEDARGYFEVLRQVVGAKGIPLAVYVDRHSIFKPNLPTARSLEEQLSGRPVLTQVGRALHELGVQTIFAMSPQAKGRVERLWGTFQDRLASELRLAHAATLADANHWLPAFLRRFNRRFAVPAADPTPAYEPRPVGFRPERIFCFKYERLVRPDNTIPFAGRDIQLLTTGDRRSWVRARVEVHEHFNGQLVIYYRATRIPSRAAPAAPAVIRAREFTRLGAGRPQAPAPPPAPSPPPATRPPWKPSPTHPWRPHWKRRQPTAVTKSESS